ncbi:hypothetical protein HMPREF1141_0735 [Clostridium sp. MSTE9]|nr:hypothetical protein HMPREF1141_0735 [Clostridium sp. MSTE9]
MRHLQSWFPFPLSHIIPFPAGGASRASPPGRNSGIGPPCEKWYYICTQLKQMLQYKSFVFDLKYISKMFCCQLIFFIRTKTF